MNKRGTAAVILIVLLVGAIGVFVIFSAPSSTGAQFIQPIRSIQPLKAQPIAPQIAQPIRARTCMDKCKFKLKACEKRAEDGYTDCASNVGWETAIGECVPEHSAALEKCGKSSCGCITDCF